jgi:hypothetical protein
MLRARLMSVARHENSQVHVNSSRSPREEERDERPKGIGQVRLRATVERDRASKLCERASTGPSEETCEDPDDEGEPWGADIGEDDTGGGEDARADCKMGTKYMNDETPGTTRQVGQPAEQVQDPMVGLRGWASMCPVLS